MKHLILSVACILSGFTFTARSEAKSSDGTFVDCGSLKLQHIYNSALKIGNETFTIPEIAAELTGGGYRGVLIQMTSDSVNFLITDYEVDGASAKVSVSSFGRNGTEATLYLTKNDEIVSFQKCALVK